MLYSAHMRPRRLIAVVLVSLAVLFIIVVAVRRSQRDDEPGSSATPAVTDQPTVTDQRTPAAADTPPAGETPKVEPVASINVITEEGGRVDWSDKLDLIAFDRLGG